MYVCVTMKESVNPCMYAYMYACIIHVSMLVCMRMCICVYTARFVSVTIFLARSPGAGMASRAAPFWTPTRAAAIWLCGSPSESRRSSKRTGQVHSPPTPTPTLVVLLADVVFLVSKGVLPISWRGCLRIGVRSLGGASPGPQHGHHHSEEPGARSQRRGIGEHVRQVNSQQRSGMYVCMLC